MKKTFSIRILAMLLCLLMVIPTLVLPLSAEEINKKPEPTEDNPLRNIAPNGQTYHSSVWNNDRHAKYINNGLYTHSYQWWEPSSIHRPNGAGVDDKLQWCGISYMSGYYIVKEINIYTSVFEKGYNNIKYTIKALILGEWVEVGVGYNDDSVSTKWDGIGKLTIQLNHPDGEYVNTNNIRIECSEYGAYSTRPSATSHDWWLTPKIHEVELMGYNGYKPEFEVPMGAYLVTNAALSGMIGATSSLDSYYPYLAGDKKPGTYWKANDRNNRAPQAIWAIFDKEYTIDDVGFNVGGCAGSDAGLELTVNVKILKSGTVEDGVWETVIENYVVTTVSEPVDDVKFTLDAPTTALGMKIEYVNVKDPTASGSQQGRAVVTELSATISEGKKCIFLADYITYDKRESTASGNLACYGKAYASSNFSYASISDPSYIIDGQIAYTSFCWIAENYVIGTYAGVTLRETHAVTKVVLYFNDYLAYQDNTKYYKDAAHVFSFDVQANKDGEFVTVAQASSYDKERDSYIVSVEFAEPVVTDDIRIVFTSDAMTFPYLKEMEIFEADFVYSSYLGYVLDPSRTQGGPDKTNVFGTRTCARRGKYLDKITPIEYFNIALEHDIPVDWLTK